MGSHHLQHGPVEPTILIVSGLNGSGPNHWQSHWERDYPNAQRVDLGMWDNPHRNTWVNKLNLAIERARRPVILVAHSLGCHAVAWWAEYERPAPGDPVVGALLVAPPEVEAAGVDPRLARFAPVLPTRMPFLSILAASRNDPYISYGRARKFARTWGSRLVDVGPLGHINAESGIADWPYGKYLLNRLIAAVTPQRTPLLRGRAAETLMRFEQQELMIGR
jgi:predicted alpha/beta hydrolase family esterase